MFNINDQITVISSKKVYKPNSLGFFTSTRKETMSIEQNYQNSSVLFFRLGKLGKFRLVSSNVLHPIIQYKKIFKSPELIGLMKIINIQRNVKSNSKILTQNTLS